MSDEDTENADQHGGVSWRVYVIAGMLLAALFGFLEWITWNSEQGGLMSTISALRAASSGAPDINVDHAGLRYPIY